MIKFTRPVHIDICLLITSLSLNPSHRYQSPFLSHSKLIPNTDISRVLFPLNIFSLAFPIDAAFHSPVSRKAHLYGETLLDHHLNCPWIILHHITLLSVNQNFSSSYSIVCLPPKEQGSWLQRPSVLFHDESPAPGTVRTQWMNTPGTLPSVTLLGCPEQKCLPLAHSPAGIPIHEMIHGTWSSGSWSFLRCFCFHNFTPCSQIFKTNRKSKILLFFKMIT